MKKKFLSLMMAAAVVATTSVSAFAAEEIDYSVTGETTINNVLDSDEIEHNVNITGKIQDQNGVMPATTFKVTVPTAANFTVSSSGTLVGPELEVKNEGPQGIEVYATDFSKVTNGRLKVVKSTDLTNVPRSTVSLKLVVNGAEKAHLAADGTKNGVYKNGDLDEQTQGGEQLLSLGAASNNEVQKKSIQIKGSAGNQAVDKAVSDTFKLVLKIKKAPVTPE